MNILIKLTCLIGLVIAPILGEGTVNHAEQEPTVEMTIETIEEVAVEDIEVEIANENNNVIATEEVSSAVTIEDKK